MDAWTWVMKKGAAKCNMHCDLQGLVSQGELERMLYPMGFPQGVLCLSAFTRDSCGACNLRGWSSALCFVCQWVLVPVAKSFL